MYVGSSSTLVGVVVHVYIVVHESSRCSETIAVPSKIACVKESHSSYIYIYIYIYIIIEIENVYV